MVAHMGDTIVVAVKGLIFNKGKMLILKRADTDDVGPGTWENAGGKIEFGEELEDALIREVKEEAGLDVSVEKLLYAATFKSHPWRQLIILTYLCKTQNNTVTLSAEHSDFLWASKSEVRDYLPPDILADFNENGIFEMDVFDQI